MSTAAQPDRMLGNAQAAERAGVAEGTWKGYVSRGQAPAPDRRNPRTGRPEWAPETVDAWLAARPGQGSRTDLDDKHTERSRRMTENSHASSPGYETGTDPETGRKLVMVGDEWVSEDEAAEYARAEAEALGTLGAPELHGRRDGGERP